MKKLSVKRERVRRGSFILAASLIMMLFLYGGGHKFHAAYDTYEYLAAGRMGSHVSWMLYDNGRIVIAGLFALSDLLNFSPAQFFYFSYTLAMLAGTLAVLIYTLKLSDVLGSSVMAFALSSALILNPFSLTFFLFIESGGFFLGILSAALAAASFDCFYTGRRKRYFVLAAVFTLLTEFCYQPVLLLEVILVMPFVIYRSSGSIVRWLKLNVAAVLPVGAAVLVEDFLLKVWFHSSRTFELTGSAADPSRAMDYIREVGKDAYHVFDGILPEYFWQSLNYTLFGFTLCMILLISYRKGKRASVRALFDLVYIIAAVVAMNYFLFASTGQDAMRMGYDLGAVPALLMLNLLLTMRETGNLSGGNSHMDAADNEGAGCRVTTRMKTGQAGNASGVNAQMNTDNNEGTSCRSTGGGRHLPEGVGRSAANIRHGRVLRAAAG